MSGQSAWGNVQAAFSRMIIQETTAQSKSFGVISGEVAVSIS